MGIGIGSHITTHSGFTMPAGFAFDHTVGTLHNLKAHTFRMGLELRLGGNSRRVFG